MLINVWQYRIKILTSFFARNLSECVNWCEERLYPQSKDRKTVELPSLARICGRLNTSINDILHIKHPIVTNNSNHYLFSFILFLLDFKSYSNLKYDLCLLVIYKPLLNSCFIELELDSASGEWLHSYRKAFKDIRWKPELRPIHSDST